MRYKPSPAVLFLVTCLCYANASACVAAAILMNAYRVPNNTLADVSTLILSIIFSLAAVSDIFVGVQVAKEIK